MSNFDKTITVYLENRDEDVDILVCCEYEVMNNGIGEYEYWGQKCIDKGEDYVVIVDTEWNKVGFTEEEVAIIEKEIDEQKGTWEGEVVISDGGITDRED